MIAKSCDNPLKPIQLTGWSCITWDPEERLETELEVISQNAPLIINHHASGQVSSTSEHIVDFIIVASF